MDFRVYVIIEAPILDKKYELMIPIDRRIHDLITVLKKAIPDLNRGYYAENSPCMYNKSTGEMYDMNTIVKYSNIKTGTRIVLI